MADGIITIKLDGVEHIIAAISRFPRQAERYAGQAGNEAADEILDTEGLRKYPPVNRPPRGFKTDKQRRFFFAALRKGQIEVPYRRGASPGSERYGTHWEVETVGLTTTIGNAVSYAEILAGNDTQQSTYMAGIGWRQLEQVAEEKVEDITKIYQGWMDKMMRDLFR
jgi:hypothetical protein